MRGGLLASVLVVLALLAPATAAAATLPPEFEEITLADGLEFPTAAAWTPDGRLLVAEKRGRLWSLPAGGGPRRLVLDISGHVNSYIERGLIGLAVDRDFASNGFVYLLYTHEANPLDPRGPKTARLTRIVLEPDDTVADPANPEVVLLGRQATVPCPPPSNTSDCFPADNPTHTVGTVIPDPSDGSLWVGAGDGADWRTVNDTAFRTFDERSYSGKILHIDRQGRGLPGHPFCPSDANLAHVCTKVHAKGFRNPFRFTLGPGGAPIVGDVGAGSWEEIDLVRRGRNYGWPCHEGPARTPGYQFDARCKALYAKVGTDAGATAPDHHYPRAGVDAAVVGGPRYTGARYPSEYVGDVFFADYARGWIKRLRLGPGGVVGEAPFAEGLSSIVDLEQTPDGELAYVSAFGGTGGRGAVRVLSFRPGPIARVGAEPRWGPLQVRFTGSRSSDPAGGGLEFEWDFGDGSPPSTEPDPTHVYESAGRYTATLTITDAQGRTSRGAIDVWPGNTPPEVRITAPGEGSSYRAGRPVALRAEGVDAEDGPLPAGAYTWRVRLRHDDHLHDHADRAGPQATLVPGDDHDADSHYVIALTVVDSLGLETTERIRIHPETVRLRLESSPPGAAVSYADRALVTPADLRAAIGFRTTVAAPESVTSDGLAWLFGRWSDGGGRLHDIVVPDRDDVISAIYERPPLATAPPAGCRTSRIAMPAAVEATPAGRLRLRLGLRCRGAFVAGERLVIREVKPSGKVRRLRAITTTAGASTTALRPQGRLPRALRLRFAGSAAAPAARARAQVHPFCARPRVRAPRRTRVGMDGRIRMELGLGCGSNRLTGERLSIHAVDAGGRERRVGRVRTRREPRIFERRVRSAVRELRVAFAGTPERRAHVRRVRLAQDDAR